ncbi:glycosyltransferase [Chaetomidium leptoderma]|uniref:Glycosyltransferase n=1 Tax=Chaetomidium leptoderma TaxID=669021 RepID=A0AAN6VJ12_9PEZI|nr:glycosyltransferase [Chaetomidium leptoderma]
MRRPFNFAWPAACLLLVALTLYVRREQLSQLPRPASSFLHPPGEVKAEPSAPTAEVVPTTTASVPSPTHHAVLPQETRTAYVNAIMNPDAADLPRLQCPKLDASRYQQLQATSKDVPDSTIQYFFALDLRQCVALLPRLIGSVVETIRFLGPKACALSVIEGNSDDGTGEVLAALQPELEALGVTFYFSTTAINPKKGDRIAALAELRNLAIQPILDNNNELKYTANDTTIIFLNDVAICPEDILELVHQRVHLGADLVCGMDWTYVGNDPTFYDVWIARALNGDSFFEIPADGNWNSAWNLFWNSADTQARFAAHQPFQVFSCWNGGAVFTAAPLLEGEGEEQVRFRTVREGECAQGEPELFCKDLWFRGHGKIAVVPTVNLEYSDEAGAKIKEAKGYTSRWVGGSEWKDEKIEWQAEPPEKVKCMAVYSNQFFEPWNQSLVPGT